MKVHLKEIIIRKATEPAKKIKQFEEAKLFMVGQLKKVLVGQTN